jgi:hypothetical protein
MFGESYHPTKVDQLARFRIVCIFYQETFSSLSGICLQIALPACFHTVPSGAFRKTSPQPKGCDLFSVYL